MITSVCFNVDSSARNVASLLTLLVCAVQEMPFENADLCESTRAWCLLVTRVAEQAVGSWLVRAIRFLP